MTLDDYQPGYHALFTDSLRKETDWDPEYADAVVADALRFLRVCADHPEQRLVCSVAVDEAVDRMILDTPLFRWLQLRLGREIDHVPGYAHGQDRTQQTTAYTATIVYLRESGPVDSAIWAELPAACGGTGCHMKVIAGCWQSCRVVAA